MIWWTGLAPWEFESPFPGSLTSTFLRRTEQWLGKVDTFFSKVDLSRMPVYDISDDDEDEVETLNP